MSMTKRIAFFFFRRILFHHKTEEIEELFSGDTNGEESHGGFPSLLTSFQAGPG